jgi:serine/threonine-protein kinase
MLYEMVAGVPAFSGDNLGRILNAILHGNPPPPSQFRAGVPAQVDDVLARATHKNPSLRYQDAAEMARDLAQCRIELARLQGTPLPSLPAADPYAETAPVAEIPVAAAAAALPGLALSRLFDSTVGLQKLLEQDGAPAAGALRKPRQDVSARAWSAAYVGALLAALALAFV